MSAELDEKIERLCRLMSEQDLAGILINSQPNFAWLTCGRSNGVDQSREHGVASLVICRDGRRSVLASRIEMPRMLSETLDGYEFEPVEFAWQKEKGDPGLTLETAEKLAAGSVGTEARLGREISRCRYSLTTDEVDRYRALGGEAAEAVSKVALGLTPGSSEVKIAERMRAELANKGMTSVVTLVAADERVARFRHPVPTEKRFEKTALLVTCARRAGLTASLSRIVSLGVPDADLIRKTEAAVTVHAELLAATREGASGASLYRVASESYSRAGFAEEIDLHHQGGATGYSTRDWVAHPTCGDKVQKRQAFAWNPSITGTKVEDTMIVTGNDAEVLTSTPEFPSIVKTINGREYTSAGILTI